MDYIKEYGFDLDVFAKDIGQILLTNGADALYVLLSLFMPPCDINDFLCGLALGQKLPEDLQIETENFAILSHVKFYSDLLPLQIYWKALPLYCINKMKQGASPKSTLEIFSKIMQSMGCEWDEENHIGYDLYYTAEEMIAAIREDIEQAVEERRTYGKNNVE